MRIFQKQSFSWDIHFILWYSFTQMKFGICRYPKAVLFTRYLICTVIFFHCKHLSVTILPPPSLSLSLSLFLSEILLHSPCRIFTAYILSMGRLIFTVIFSHMNKKNMKTPRLFVTIWGGAIAQWSRNPVTRVQNQGDALVTFGKALILITRSLGEDLKLSAIWLLTYKHLCFLSSQVK